VEKGDTPGDRGEEAQTLVERGLALYGKGDVPGAVRHWRAAQEADPENRRVLEYLAFVRENDGIDPEQIPIQRGAIQVEPEPIGPPRAVVIPEYIPNPPGGVPEVIEVTISSSPPRRPLQEPTAARETAPPSAPRAKADPLTDLAQEMRDRLGQDDFSGALEMSEKVLALAPEHLEALEVRDHASQSLMRIWESKIGDLKAVPVVKIPADEVIWLNLNHREGFVLSQVDGLMRYEDILDVCGMPRLEALRVIANLVADGVIGPA
jgi:tetratricopeptide (TPR) repeat protein